MANKKVDSKKWGSFGGRAKPVDLNSIDFVNTPKKSVKQADRRRK